MNTRSRTKKKQHDNPLVSQSSKLHNLICRKGASDKASQKVSPLDITNGPSDKSTTVKQTNTGSPRAGGVQHNSSAPKEVLFGATKIDSTKARQPKGLRTTSESRLQTFGLPDPTVSKRSDGSKDDYGRSKEQTLGAKQNKEESKRDRRESDHQEATTLEAARKMTEAESSSDSAAAEQKSSSSPKPPGNTSPTPVTTETLQGAERDSCETTLQIGPASHEESESNAPPLHQQTDGNGTSSSSSSRLVARPRRVSLAYLQRTRARRRAIAKSRAERQRHVAAEEKERERIKELEGMDEDKKECLMKIINEEKRERETARRREVQRVRNRESVEKSRVRELVLESEVENETDVLKWENERIASFLEWVRKENVMREVKKEFSAFTRKRKRTREYRSTVGGAEST